MVFKITDEKNEISVEITDFSIRKLDSRSYMGVTLPGEGFVTQNLRTLISILDGNIETFIDDVEILNGKLQGIEYARRENPDGVTYLLNLTII